jgi:hypothetical protein
MLKKKGAFFVFAVLLGLLVPSASFAFPCYCNGCYIGDYGDVGSCYSDCLTLPFCRQSTPIFAPQVSQLDTCTGSGIAASCSPSTERSLRPWLELGASRVTPPSNPRVARST